MSKYEERSAAREARIIAECEGSGAKSLRVISNGHQTNERFLGKNKFARAAALVNQINNLGFRDWMILDGQGFTVLTSYQFDRSF